jgi:hypothetical protein
MYKQKIIKTKSLSKKKGFSLTFKIKSSMTRNKKKLCMKIEIKKEK